MMKKFPACEAHRSGAAGMTGSGGLSRHGARPGKGKSLPVSARLILAGILAVSLGLLVACSGKSPAGNGEQEATPAMTLPEGCTRAHVFAPGNYIVDVEGGAVVTLHPEVQTFPLFCSPDGARAFAAMLVANGDLPKGDWQVYRLEGNFSDLAEQVSPNEYILRVKARIGEWVPDKLEQDRARDTKKLPARSQAGNADKAGDRITGKEQAKPADASAGKPDGQGKATESHTAQ